MDKLSVKDVRRQLSSVIRNAESGGATVITRYGTPIAKIAPVAKSRSKFPDMSEFRKRFKKRGKTLTETLRKMRDEERS